MTTDLRILLDFDGDRRDIGDYERAGGYRQLTKALAGAPEDVVAAVDSSGLRGREVLLHEGDVVVIGNVGDGAAGRAW